MTPAARVGVERIPVRLAQLRKRALGAHGIGPPGGQHDAPAGGGKDVAGHAAGRVGRSLRIHGALEVEVSPGRAASATSSFSSVRISVLNPGSKEKSTQPALMRS